MRIWVLLAVMAAAAACGGQVSGNPDAGGEGHGSSASSSGSASNSGSSGSGGGTTSGSGGGGSGSGSGGPIPLCPPDPPTVGSPCASPGQGCAYFVGGQCEGYRCRSSGWEMDPTVTCP